jgi:hypothetical protein
MNDASAVVSRHEVRGPMTSTRRAAIRPDIHERFMAVVAKADARWRKTPDPESVRSVQE